MKRFICYSTIVLLLTTAVISCSKSSGSSTETPTPEPPGPEEPRIEKDVTSDALLYVNIENTRGANSAEGSFKLVDRNNDTKFLIYEFLPHFFMQLSFKEAQQVAAYTLTSANDASSRDPKHWTITASKDSINWVTLDNQVHERFEKRGRTKRYDFQNTEAYKHYRLNITANHGDKAFQIAEWRLLFVPRTTQKGNKTTLDTTSKNGLTLYFVDKSPDLNTTLKSTMKDVFYTNYPKLMEKFNPAATKEVTFVVDPEYDGVAMAGGGVVTYSPEWLRKNPKDIDVVTHEIMHIAQAYPGWSGPSWITEGIADYVRHVYGIDNPGANWYLPSFSSSQKYTDSYRVTARFFSWLEAKVKKDIILTLDGVMRRQQYTENFWKEHTGKTVDELWNEYAQNPTI